MRTTYKVSGTRVINRATKAIQSQWKTVAEANQVALDLNKATMLASYRESIWARKRK